ncbi:MAG: peptidoglycan DD-metalloendopeptidase family protein [Burkholderiales bacterium]
MVINHDGRTFTQYAHLGTVLVNPGDRVVAGQTIGTVGRSGNTPPFAATHLHFEVRLFSARPKAAGGTVVDPRTSLGWR